MTKDDESNDDEMSNFKSILRLDLKTGQFAAISVFTACIMGLRKLCDLFTNNKVGIIKRKPGKTKTPCWYSQKHEICASK